MKYPEEHKEIVNKRLRQNASKQLRTRGVAGVSVKSVMASEGMTVGGFYAHFDSKQALLIEALKSAFKDSERLFSRRPDECDDKNWLKTALHQYLSEFHRDHIDRSCPISSLMGDIAREDESVKQVFQEGLEHIITLYAKRLAEDNQNETEPLAMALVSMLAGGIQLSRSVADPDYSRQILRSCIQTAERLLEP